MINDMSTFLDPRKPESVVLEKEYDQKVRVRHFCEKLRRWHTVRLYRVDWEAYLECVELLGEKPGKKAPKKAAAAKE